MKIQKHGSEDVQHILKLVDTAQKDWSKRPVAERAKLVGQVGQILLKRKEELAKICSEEMGKILKESIAEVEKCALACQYYGENAAQFLEREDIKTEGKESYVVYRPLGVVLAVMPWNFPFWQVIRFAAPGLCAGNGAVLKHASDVPRCSLALESVFREAGLPENIFRSLLIGSQDVAAVIENPIVKAVTLTGSTAAGKKVAGKAGECLKKAVLELGGSDAYLILADADLADAAKTLVKGRLLNAGQSCISPKRFIAVKEIYSAFKELVLEEAKKVTFGDPFDPSSMMGPMSRMDLRDELHQQVKKTVAQGAKLLLGGEIPQKEGAYYPPTVLADVTAEMCAFKEELFGPVITLIEARDEAHALELANDSLYGLGGGIFTADTKHGQKLAEASMESGGVFINDFLKSDPRLPFGGIKESGFGRELCVHGIREFVNAKTIYVKSSSR